MLTGKQLAEFCLKVHAAGWVYWYGTCGYKCTQSLYNSKKNQYPDAYTAARASGYKKDIANGCMAADCVGLIKAFFWMSGDVNGKNVRKANNCPDTNAGGMYRLCKENGPIATIPDVPGLVVWKSGHIGVYVGNGYTVEMKGFAYDCQKNKVTSGKWTNWGKLPANMLSYDGGELPAPPAYKLGDRELRAGCEGSDVAELQGALVALGFDCGTFGPGRDGIDGDYGDKTAAAVRAFQQASGISVTGVADLGTIKVLAASAQAGQITPGDEDGAPEDGGEPAADLGSRTLRKGDKGDDVAELQRALVALGFDCGTFGPGRDGIDGDYGSKTRKAVEAMQRAAGVSIDGIYGPKSHAALMAMQTAGGEPALPEGGDAGEEPDTYTITIPGVDAATTAYLLEAYAGATATLDAAKA